jgi:bifunctional DNA-binding transcriptional regulator/antitoxin component of YhaV-PrlF toxin-antitoxin module
MEKTMANSGFSDVAADMQAQTSGLSTKADKIRSLAKAGYTRQQIADFLGIRYQHVRNVLVDDERRAKAALGPAPPDWPTDLETKSAKPADRACRVGIGPNGQIVLPKHLMEAAGTGPGKYLLVRFADDEIRLVTPEATTRKIQAWVRGFVPEGVSLPDELREERELWLKREEELCRE